MRISFLVLFCCLLVFGCGSVNSNYIDQLHSGTPEQKAQAASFLGAQHVTEAVPDLIAALKDENTQVRGKVIWALGMMRSKAALQNLLPLMQDPNRDIRQATARALMQIEEPEAITILEKALKIESDGWIVKDIQAAIKHLRQFEGEADLGESTVRGEFF